MALQRSALSIFVVVSLQLTALGQMVMVSPMLAGMRRHPSQSPPIRMVRPMYQPAAIISRPAYEVAESTLHTEPKEPIDEQRLHVRIKELEIQKQNIAQKQLDLEDKITILDEQIISCHKQIEEDQEVLRKLQELERVHSAEQIRLERLIQQQRMVEYQARIEQERLARQRAAVEEWNHAQKERQKEINSEVVVEEEEPVSVSAKEKQNATPLNKLATQKAGQLSSEVQIQRPDQLSHPTTLQVHEDSKHPDIGQIASKNNGKTQVVKRASLIGPVPRIEESVNGNITAQHQLERKL